MAVTRRQKNRQPTTPTSTSTLLKWALTASLASAILATITAVRWIASSDRHSPGPSLDSSWMQNFLLQSSSSDRPRRRPHPPGPAPILGKEHRILRGWEQPVVFPEYNFVFFPVPKAGSTTFDRLFLRMVGDPSWDDGGGGGRHGRDHQTVHDRARKVLRSRLLGSIDRGLAQEAMTSPNWTRAIFVREPKERLLSAYLHKVRGTRGFYGAEVCCRRHVDGPIQGMSPSAISDMVGTFERCSPRRSAREILAMKRTCDRWLEVPLNRCVQRLSTLEGFVDLVRNCSDPHWSHQSARVDDDFWDYINFVGYMDTARSDARRLLQSLGKELWENFGASGWGKDGTEAFFEGGTDLNHRTGSRSKYREYYTWDLERKVNAFYESDFHHNVLQLSRYLPIFP